MTEKWNGVEHRNPASLSEMHSAITVVEGKVDVLKENFDDMKGKIDKIYAVMFEGNGKDALVTRIGLTEKDVTGLLKREGNRNKAVMAVVLTFVATMVTVFFDVIRGK